MQNPGDRSPVLACQDLQEAWRLRSERARERYARASARYRELLKESPEGLIPGQNDPLALARQAESKALAEYTRIVKIYTELIVHGQIPKEQLGAMANGG